jgi:hypothetical protein
MKTSPVWKGSAWAVAVLAAGASFGSSPGAQAPVGLEDGRIQQGLFLVFGDPKGGVHLMRGSEVLIRDIGIACGNGGYWPYDRMAEVKVARGRGTLAFSGKVPQRPIVYEHNVSIEGNRIKFVMRRTGAWGRQGWDSLNFRLPIEGYRGAKFRADGGEKTYAVKYSPGLEYLASNVKKVECHLGDPSLDLIFECAHGMSVSDERRWGGQNYCLSVGIPRDQQEGSSEVYLTLPQVPAGAGVAVRRSRIGYPVAGPKVVVLEWPRHGARPDDDAVRLEKVDGTSVKRGRFDKTVNLPHMQCDFAAFDFSEVQEPGDYRIVWSGGKVDVPIRKSVFEDKLWEPTLDYFIPFQMCHADVDFGGQAPEHTRCHMDDGVRVPAHFPGVDRFQSYESEGTPYKAGDPIPCAGGGWHDAGDCDLNIYAQGLAVWVLALAYEEFGIKRDVATLDAGAGKFTLGKPDGVPDILQQIEWGVIWLLSMLQPDGRSYVGIIDLPNRYSQPGKKWSEMTDNKPGTGDERQVYVDYHSELQLMQATVLCAAGRALRPTRPELAKKCLDNAARALEYFRTHKEVYRSTVYFYPEHKGRDGMLALTLAEIYLATKGAACLKELEGMAETVRNLPVADPHISSTTASSFWYAPPVLARLHAVLPDGALKSAIVEVCRRAAEVQARSESPRPWPFHYWHFGNWGQAPTGAVRTFDAYWLSKVVPDGFPVSAALRSMLWIYGLHPLNDRVFVSGLGYPGPEYIHSGQIFGLFGSEPGTVPGALIGGLNGLFPWVRTNVLYYRDDGNCHNNEAGLSTAPLYLFAVNAMKKAGF